MCLSRSHKTGQCKRRVLLSLKKTCGAGPGPSDINCQRLAHLCCSRCQPLCFSQQGSLGNPRAAPFIRGMHSIQARVPEFSVTAKYLSLLIPSEGVFILYHFSKETLSRWKMKGPGVRKKFRLWEADLASSGICKNWWIAAAELVFA